MIVVVSVQVGHIVQLPDAALAHNQLVNTGLHRLGIIRVDEGVHVQHVVLIRDAVSIDIIENRKPIIAHHIVDTAAKGAVVIIRIRIGMHQLPLLRNIIAICVIHGVAVFIILNTLEYGDIVPSGIQRVVLIADGSAECNSKT